MPGCVGGKHGENGSRLSVSQGSLTMTLVVRDDDANVFLLLHPLLPCLALRCPALLCPARFQAKLDSRNTHTQDTQDLPDSPLPSTRARESRRRRRSRRKPCSRRASPAPSAPARGCCAARTVRARSARRRGSVEVASRRCCGELLSGGRGWSSLGLSVSSRPLKLTPPG